MLPALRRLASVLLATCLSLALAHPASAAMDVAKQVLIGADYSGQDLRGATFSLSNPVSYTHLTLPTTPYV